MQLVAEPPLPSTKVMPAASSAPPPDMDQRVILNGMTWKDYEILLAVRGDRAGVRMAYLDGAIELMSPSISHESVKKTIARLVETYGDESSLDLNGYGSWTLKNALVERGLEPDECYVIGIAREEDVPQLAVEVVWTSGGLNKLEIYRSLGVGEVWIWERGKGITVHLLHGDRYEIAPRSALLPALDLQIIERYAMEPNQAKAVREFRAILRAGQGATSSDRPSAPKAAPPPRPPRRRAPR